MRAQVFGLCLAWLGLGCGGAATSPAASETPNGASEASSTVGYTELRLEDTSRQRLVWIDLWYPATSSAQSTPLRYGLASGQAARDALPADGEPRTLLIFSHGAGGSATDCAWLTEHLAARGYIVAGVNHYGESRIYGVSTVDRLAILRTWTRPADVRFAIASLFAHEQWGTRLRPDHVGGLGHSAGGHALLVLAGATYDESRLAAYCQTDASRSDRGCAYASELSPADWTAVGRRPAGPLPTEARLSALFLMEPAMGPGFIKEDLQKVRATTEIVATEPGDFLPFAPHAGHIAKLLPRASLRVLDHSGGHFVFLGECELGIDVLGVPLCTDAPGVVRSAVHAEVAEFATRFFDGALAP